MSKQNGMSIEPSLMQLGQEVQDCISILKDYGVVQPTFAADGPSQDIVSPADTELVRVRNNLVNAARRIADLAVGPKKLLVEQTLGHHKLAVLRFLYVFNVVPNVPLERTITYEELASACGLREDVDKLRRIVRYAIGMRLLREPFPDEVAHSAASRILATEQPARDWLGRNVMEALPSAVCLTDALSKWPGNTSKDKTAANIAFGYQGSWFEWLRTQPERAARFGGGMGFMSSDAKDTAVTDVTQGFAWEELPARSKFVDVGGGNGQIAIEILRRAGQLRGVVQDQQSVISQIGGPPNDLGDRLKFEVADFFAPQEEKDAEVYLFRRVFHDWPDTDCLRVLHATIPSMKTGATLLVNDFVLPRPGTVGDWDEQWLRGVDLQMMITFNSRERTLDDWVKLVEGGSKGRLKLQRSSKSILSFVKID